MGWFNDAFDTVFHGNEKPYERGNEEYQKYMGQAIDAQNPFIEFGKKAMPGYEKWLGGMEDPSGFINNLTNKYQQSPWAKYQQEQSLKAGQNAASASGLMGSTPFLKASQQNAADISSHDMESWLSKVLGINSQYGQGLNNQIGIGQTGATNVSNLLNDRAENSAGLAYGQQKGRGADVADQLGSVLSMFGGGGGWGGGFGL